MSGVAVVNYLLSNYAALVSLVPAERIFSGPIPLNPDGTSATDLPAIGVTQISGTEWDQVSRPADSSQFRSERVQVTVHAASYAEKKPILDLVRKACAPKPASPVDGTAVDSIKPEGEGPDLDDWEAQIFEQSRDFIVKWHTPSTPAHLLTESGDALLLEDGGLIQTE